MENFTFYNPTKIIFGSNTIADLTQLIPEEKKILLTYGGGSIKHNGVYEQVISALQGRTVLEFGGIEPNPKYETLMKAVDVVQQEKIDFLLAVGGGSVIDGTKFIAAAALYQDGDPWQFVRYRDEIIAQEALPLGVVLTLPATGSEMNNIAVISRISTNEKFGFSSPAFYPRFSILQPEVTFSLPKNQVRNGIVDAFIHVTEQYLTVANNTPLQDRQAEAILLTLIEEGPKTLENRSDYDSRANLIWCATQALNGLLRCGTFGDFSTHAIGHELTALYGLAHAETLAIVLPSLLRRKQDTKAAKLKQYAQRVWGVDPHSKSVIEEGIQRTEKFFHTLGMPTRLSDYIIDASEAANRIQARFAERDAALGEHKDITAPVVAEILRMSA